MRVNVGSWGHNKLRHQADKKVSRGCEQAVNREGWRDGNPKQFESKLPLYAMHDDTCCKHGWFYNTLSAPQRIIDHVSDTGFTFSSVMLCDQVDREDGCFVQASCNGSGPTTIIIAIFAAKLCLALTFSLSETVHLE